MLNIISTLLVSVGTSLGNVSTLGCFFVFLDEPTMPESMIK